MALINLTCCVCGDAAGKYKQHWNRDTGFGGCRTCIDWQISRGTTPDEIYSLYGIAGVNYEAKQFVTFSRSFNILAEFPESQVDEANAYMLGHPGASVIAVVDGRVVLADKADKGTPITHQPKECYDQV